MPLSPLSPRERRIVSLYYFKEATMKRLGRRLASTESRVSQLHARAMSRLRETLAPAAGRSACSKMRGG
ncbi:MAG: FliA/WhiG family RNA polymerase sigma factor, partial [Acidobacteria bacterium]|nr:FliA/WhiG family RNA polymerase sigma factor [Acidobacteriota bacterium]